MRTSLIKVTNILFVTLFCLTPLTAQTISPANERSVQDHTSKKETLASFSKKIIPLAQSGNQAAMLEYGERLILGQDVEAAPEKGIDFLNKITEKDLYTRAQEFLGIQYIQGKHLTLNIPLGLEYLEKAAHQGSPRAAYLLGFYDDFGSLTTPSKNKTAQPQIENVISSTISSKKDKNKAIQRYSEAIPLLEKALAAPSTWNNTEDNKVFYAIALAELYGRKDLPFFSPKKSFENWLLASNSNDTRAIKQVGLYYATGMGTSVDKRSALNWLNRAIIQGDTSCLLDAAILKAELEGGTTAVPYLEALGQSQLSNPKTLCLIATYYQSKTFGKQQERAYHWLNQAAEQESPEAQQRLAYMYLHGIGTERSIIQAARYYIRASLNGDHKARTLLLSVGGIILTGFFLLIIIILFFKGLRHKKEIKDQL